MYRLYDEDEDRYINMTFRTKKEAVEYLQDYTMITIQKHSKED